MAFVQAGSNTKQAMKYHNVVNQPLDTGSDIFFLPEHHMYTGIAGKIVKELERKVYLPQEPRYTHNILTCYLFIITFSHSGQTERRELEP